MKAKLTTKTILSIAPHEKPYDVRDTDLPGFVLSVLPSGTMSYYCDYRREDKRRTRVKLGDTRLLTPAQARDEALKVLADVARKQDPAAARRVARQETLKVFIEKNYQPWAESHLRTGKEAVRRMQTCFEEFENLKLTELSAWKIEKWRSLRLKKGNCALTVNRSVSMLKASLSKAVEWGMIDAHPLAKVKPLKVDSAANIRFLSDIEEKTLRDTLDVRERQIREERRSHNNWCLSRGYDVYPDLDQVTYADYLKPMVLVSVNTGIRRGELFNLKWDNIDFARKILTIDGNTAKSGKTRHIPLNKEALETLRFWRSQTDKLSALVFPNKDGTRFDNIRKCWEGLLDLAKIENFRWHDLRHHFASKLVMLGVDLNTVRELLGHGDIKMTLRYAHLAPKVKADAVAKLDLSRLTAASIEEIA